MTTNQIIICIIVTVAIGIIVPVLIAIIRSGVLQRFYQRISGTQGFKTFKRIMSVLLGVLVVFVIGYFIYTGSNL